MKIGFLAVFAIVSSFLAHPASSDDWPQILGPARNGVATGEKLLDKWPETGPEKIWEVDCGQGFAGVAVVNDRVYLFHRIKKLDLVECLDAKTGNPFWKKEFESVYRGGFSSDTGPRCVPLVYKNSLFLYGAGGTLRRLESKSGKQIWSKNLFDEYQANEGYFGAGSTPVIVDDTLVIIVGGKKGGIVGLDLDGKFKWKTEADTASYSAPVELTFKNQKAVACVSKFKLKVVNVATGTVLLDQEFGKRGPTVNAAAPLVFDKQLFVSSSYNIGGRMIALKDGKTIWDNDESMSSQYTTCIVHEGHLFGCNGREDFGNGSLRCVRASDGKVIWDEAGTGVCHLIKSGNRALVWNIDGSLQLIELDKTKFSSLGKSQVFTQNSKSLPALSNGRLFVKANGDERTGKLVCLLVGESSAQ